ncbi:PP2C family protein-serine/threonine phosphatase [Kitasatospora sp. NPDC002040]|uniref:PP2C family protein-serine/threonine phosphatase n=1 Tax=Kitasatospora sp. NPDC002040 TaxID=3154661 RepID=UPI00332FF18C
MRRLPELRRVGYLWSLAHWAPLVLIALAAMFDVLTPGQQRYDRFLAAAPALAAATWSVRGIAGIGALTMATEVVLSLDRDADFVTATGTALLVIVTVTAAACYASHVRQSRERDLAELRAVADVAQSVLLRPLPPALGGVELNLLYDGAAAQARIGGDFYEALRTPFGVRLIVGDVQGKGLPAVEVASVLLGTFREAAYEAPDLAALVDRLETGMVRYSEQVPSSDAAERFATAVLVEIPPDGRTAGVLNCGHPAPLLLRGREVVTVEPSTDALPLNLRALLNDHHPVDTVPFGPGDRLVIFTDGVSEARDRAGSFYPLADRVRGWTGSGSARLLELLAADLREYGSGAADDVAVLIAGRPGPEALSTAAP